MEEFEMAEKEISNIIKLQICIHPYALFNGILI